MGRRFPDNFLFCRPRLDILYSFSDHAWTSNTIPTWWLVSWDLMWPIGGDLVITITSPSCWGAHFLYLSNPPYGNLLPIIPWYQGWRVVLMLRCSGTTVSLTLRGAEPAPGGGESARKSRGCVTDIKKYRRPNFISAASRHPICRWGTSGQYWEHSGINTDKK